MLKLTDQRYSGATNTKIINTNFIVSISDVKDEYWRNYWAGYPSGARTFIEMQGGQHIFVDQSADEVLQLVQRVAISFYPN